MSEVFGVLHLFAGSGGLALGFEQAEAEWRGVRGRFITLGGVDVDPEACADFERLTRGRATVLDLFAREDYAAFHGHAPPPGWREATPADLRQATGGIAPDVVALSPPCKGFSALLPAARARAAKYQALNRLVGRGLFLTLEAFANDPPALVLLENVPRITSRGAGLLADVRKLLGAYGYVFAEGYHDCGELGGLAQRRRRYLLIARHPRKLPAFVYQPPRRRVRAIGEVLGPLALPDDPAGGPMHRLPRLQWRTWVRLALIPAGRDWRALNELAGASWHPNAYRVVPWSEPAGTVTSAHAVSSTSGAAAVADPRLGHAPRRGVFQVAPWDRACGAVVGSASVRGSNGVAAVADPRLPISANRHRNMFRVLAWDRAAGCVTGSDRVGKGAPAVADPRIACRPWCGTHRILRWDEPAGTVTAAGDVHGQGAACVADPRIPGDAERPDPPPVIVALDGTWHRPLTTYELAALQGFPLIMRDGRPLALAGQSHSRWRERIGNAVPPPAARAIGEVCLQALLPGRQGAWVLGATPIWVRPVEPRGGEVAAGG